MDIAAPIVAVTRSFQRHAGIDVAFDTDRFKRLDVRAIASMLSSPLVSAALLISCGGGEGGIFAEKIENGETATTKAAKDAFPIETASGRLRTHVSTNWGTGLASATALNEGLEIARSLDASYVLMYSKELQLATDHIAGAFALTEERSLDICGFLRAGYQENQMWRVPQNTGALWNMDKLLSIGGFSPIANGDQGKHIEIPDIGTTIRAGMEDWEAILRMHKIDRDGPRIGMFGAQTPIKWDLSFKSRDPKESADNKIKQARQLEVAKAYTRMHFPYESFEDVFDRIEGRIVTDSTHD